MDLLFLGRLLQIVGAALVGGALFLRIGSQIAPHSNTAYPSQTDQPATMPTVAVTYSRLAALLGSLLIVGGGLFDLLRIAALFSRAGLLDPITLSLMSPVILTLTYGQATLARMVFALLAAFLIVRSTRVRAVHVAAVVTLLITYGFTGHGMSADPVWLGLPVHSLHITAGALWGGGLLLLALTGLSGAFQTPWFRGALQRFSRYSFYLMGLLILSGTAASTFHLFSVDDLRETSYGMTVAVKILFVVMVLVVAAIHRLFLVPSLSRSAEQPRTVWRYTLGGEALLGIALLVIAVLLATTPPPLGPPAGRLEITMAENRYRPAAIEVPAGQVIRLLLKNEDPVVHEWIVRGIAYAGGQAAAPFARHPTASDSGGIRIQVGRGDTTVVDVVFLQPGRYEISPARADLRDGGMVGELVVR